MYASLPSFPFYFFDNVEFFFTWLLVGYRAGRQAGTQVRAELFTQARR